MHTKLDLFLVFFFLVHVLISIRFTLARWRVGHGQTVNLLLIVIGILSFWFVLSIRSKLISPSVTNLKFNK